MIDPGKKSTEVPPGDSACAEVDRDLVIDGRLGLFHRTQRWLAVADIHFGYEVNQRRAGGLWPMWGMASIEERLRALMLTYQPRTLILVGDIVDGSAAFGEAVAWLSSLRELCGELILIEGNHDRGEIKRCFDFVPSYSTDGFFFHHGHLDLRTKELAPGESLMEVTGHRHPSIRFNDGAGTSLTLPVFVIEEKTGSPIRQAVLPAFSPWAGGGRYEKGREGGRVRQLACSPQRVFEVA